MLIDKLSKLVESNGLTQAEFESISYRFSPQQARLFIHLCDQGEADTPTLRATCSIGNLSDVAIRLNKKLEIRDDPRRVICLVKPNTNKFCETGVLGYWRIVDSAANDSAA